MVLVVARSSLVLLPSLFDRADIPPIESAAVMPSVVSRATAPFPFLSLACEAGRRLGAVGVLIIAEGPMDWDVVQDMSSSDIPILVASDLRGRSRQSEKSDWSQSRSNPARWRSRRRISLALIEAVANDLLQAGARVVVVYSGFEAEELDSLTVIRLGEHLEQLTARDLRALETSVPFETFKAVVDTRDRDRTRRPRRESRSGP